MNGQLRYQAGKASQLGNRRSNQDRCALIDSDGVLLLVLGDGMGGHPRGEMAAQILIDTCRLELERASRPITDPAAFLNGALKEAHDAIRFYGLQHTPPIDPRTTAVVALIQEGMVHWVHAGDSRFYLFRNGELLARTRDHSYVERLHQQGILSREELENHPHRNYVTRCLGGNGSLPQANAARRILAPGDRLLLCSDGLWGSLDEELMIDALFSTMTPEEAATALAAEAAQTAYPDSDNVTLLILRVDALPVPLQAAPATVERQPDQDLDRAIAELQNAIENFDPKP
ncbi:MAG TPA: serine/threonine-protein phosphatase [Sedimenticola thiotaurini]|uniref:Serine/threonine-protein phosphatase n=1 Tax=Sedimenticola thiotaurini TaxID=1543721 RepID=A0A831RIV9_9GAMM|nr:serine/threonine-protein phosphatase [Sedimenticola thiotaurini]